MDAEHEDRCHMDMVAGWQCVELSAYSKCRSLSLESSAATYCL